MIRIISVCFMIMASSAFADSCAFPDVQRLDQSSNIAFIGKVEKKLKDYSLSNNKYAIKVITPAKGGPQGIVTIWSANISSCGIEFRTGETYVIFVRMRDGKMTTGISSSWIMSDSYQHLTNEFMQLYKITGQTIDQ